MNEPFTALVFLLAVLLWERAREDIYEGLLI
jgi:hypothetical protein